MHKYIVRRQHHSNTNYSHNKNKGFIIKSLLLKVNCNLNDKQKMRWTVTSAEKNIT